MYSCLCNSEHTQSVKQCGFIFYLSRNTYVGMERSRGQDTAIKSLSLHHPPHSPNLKLNLCEYSPNLGLDFLKSSPPPFQVCQMPSQLVSELTQGFHIVLCHERLRCICFFSRGTNGERSRFPQPADENVTRTWPTCDRTSDLG